MKNLSMHTFLRPFICYKFSQSESCKICSRNLVNYIKYFKFNYKILENMVNAKINADPSSIPIEDVIFISKHVPTYFNTKILSFFIAQIFKFSKNIDLIVSCFRFFEFESDSECETLILELFNHVEVLNKRRMFLICLEIIENINFTKKMASSAFFVLYNSYVTTENNFLRLKIQNLVQRKHIEFMKFFPEILNTYIEHEVNKNNILDCLATFFDREKDDFISENISDISICLYQHNRYELIKTEDVVFGMPYLIAYLIESDKFDGTEMILGCTFNEYISRYGFSVFSTLLLRNVTIDESFSRFFGCQIEEFILKSISPILFSAKKMYCEGNIRTATCIYKAFSSICALLGMNIYKIVDCLLPFVEFFFEYQEGLLNYCAICHQNLSKCRQNFIFLLVDASIKYNDNILASKLGHLKYLKRQNFFTTDNSRKESTYEITSSHEESFSDEWDKKNFIDTKNIFPNFDSTSKFKNKVDKIVLKRSVKNQNEVNNSDDYEDKIKKSAQSTRKHCKIICSKQEDDFIENFDFNEIFKVELKYIDQYIANGEIQEGIDYFLKTLKDISHTKCRIFREIAVFLIEGLWILFFEKIYEYYKKEEKQRKERILKLQIPKTLTSKTKHKNTKICQSAHFDGDNVEEKKDISREEKACIGFIKILSSNYLFEQIESIRNFVFHFSDNFGTLISAKRFLGRIGIFKIDNMFFPMATSKQEFVENTEIFSLCVYLLKQQFLNVDIERQDTQFFIIQETLKHIGSVDALIEPLKTYCKPYLSTKYNLTFHVELKEDLLVLETLNFKGFVTAIFQYCLFVFKSNGHTDYFEIFKLGLISRTRTSILYTVCAMKTIFELGLVNFSQLNVFLENINLNDVDSEILIFVLHVNTFCRHKLLTISNAIKISISTKNFFYLYKYVSDRTFIEKNGTDLLQFTYFMINDLDNCRSMNESCKTVTQLNLFFDLCIEKNYHEAKKIFMKMHSSTRQNYDYLEIIFKRENIALYTSDEFNENIEMTELQSSIKHDFTETTTYTREFTDFQISDLLNTLDYIYKPSKKNNKIHIAFDDVDSSSLIVNTDYLKHFIRSQSKNDLIIEKNRSVVGFSFNINHEKLQRLIKGLNSHIFTRFLCDKIFYSPFSSQLFRSLPDSLQKNNTHNIEDLWSKNMVKDLFEKAEHAKKVLSTWYGKNNKNLDCEISHVIFDADLIVKSKNISETLEIISQRRKISNLNNFIVKKQQNINSYLKDHREIKMQVITKNEIKENLNTYDFDSYLNLDIAKNYRKKKRIIKFKEKTHQMLIEKNNLALYEIAKYKIYNNKKNDAKNSLDQLISAITPKEKIWDKAITLRARLINTREAYSEAFEQIQSNEKLFFHWGKFLEDIDSLEAFRAYISCLYSGSKYIDEVLPKLLHMMTDASNIKNNSKGSKRNSEFFKNSTKIFTEYVDQTNVRIFLPFFNSIISKLSHSNQEVLTAISHLLQKLLEIVPYKVIWNSLIMINSTNKEIVKRITKVCATLSLETRSKIQDCISLSKKIGKISKFNSKDRTELSLSNDIGIDNLFNGDVVVPNSNLNVRICKFVDKIKVFNSLQSPKKVMIIGEDGVTYTILCKPNDDLRRDYRFMDLNRMLNRIFQKNPECTRRNLHIRIYNVVPITHDMGIIEWIDGLVAIRSIVEKFYKEQNISIGQEQKKFLKKKKIGIQSFKSVLEKFPPVLYKFFDQFYDVAEYYNAIQRFTRTYAVMNIVGWFMGLGDRHLDNIMIDSKDGCAFHVDLNCIFNRGKLLEIPEKVPFRLTQNIIDAFGPLKCEGTYRKTMEVCLKALIESKDLIMANLLSFVYDPLKESLNRKKNLEEHAKGIIEELDSKLIVHDISLTVDSLIEEARSDYNLAEMYIGWASFI
ncbi:hypothetical protein EDEG_00998 [Edhazardia aedis USNM 41457]|uniref:Uncharacterized protein n=1 Tax=Edhazardia aedis (strain USNM 41457) TaxID=1003232 RepID=J8ZYQ4_EDHAE|nr:hypothetical protein EDEG_00998 [Edhazardia aedis USNM 41457]|eukprot:EJW04808.1 hypothetical protein EDEG_00998 [Edhazardia aedis USNM 41457]